MRRIGASIGGPEPTKSLKQPLVSDYSFCENWSGPTPYLHKTFKKTFQVDKNRRTVRTVPIWFKACFVGRKFTSIKPKSQNYSGQKKKFNGPEGSKYFFPVERGKTELRYQYSLGKKNCLTSI